MHMAYIMTTLELLCENKNTWMIIWLFSLNNTIFDLQKLYCKWQKIGRTKVWQIWWIVLFCQILFTSHTIQSDIHTYVLAFLYKFYSAKQLYWHIHQTLVLPILSLVVYKHITIWKCTDRTLSPLIIHVHIYIHTYIWAYNSIHIACDILYLKLCLIPYACKNWHHNYFLCII